MATKFNSIVKSLLTYEKQKVRHPFSINYQLKSGLASLPTLQVGFCKKPALPTARCSALPPIRDTGDKYTKIDQLNTTAESERTIVSTQGRLGIFSIGILPVALSQSHYRTVYAQDCPWLDTFTVLGCTPELRPSQCYNHFY